MILRNIEQQILEQVRDGLIYPQYGGYCISSIPKTVEYILGQRESCPLSGILGEAGITPGKKQKVVVLLLDAFGWDQWQRYAGDYEFLSRITDRGVVTPITSVFTSTTPVALTALHLGLTPQQHGLPAALSYFEEADRILSVMRFRSLNGEDTDQLFEAGISPKMFFDSDTFYDLLGKSGVSSYVLIHKSVHDSPYASITMKGSTVVPYVGAEGLEEALVTRLSEASSPAYFFTYWGIIDVIGHRHGIHSQEYLDILNSLFPRLESAMERVPKETAENTVLLVCADHGHINMEPQSTVYLSDYPDLVQNLRTGVNGDKILPWGEPRVMFLSVEEAKIDETCKYLADELEGIATIVKTEDAMKDGLFGTGEPHPRFISRIGDVMVLPEDNHTVWYAYPGLDKLSILGTHGGLTPEEILVPFAAVRLSDLK
ncbi:MAG: alkaline phosphatase family protein [Dehalococcoidales bacterium]|nr:alkaline phosphatase family protein [Dehalococcoidales bacterium]